MFYQHAAVPRCTTRAERERPRWQSLLNRAIGRPVNLAETDTDQAANRETGTGRYEEVYIATPMLRSQLCADDRR